MAMLENKIRINKRQLLVFNTVAKPVLDDKESNDSDKEYGNMNHYALTCQGKSKRSKKGWHGTP